LSNVGRIAKAVLTGGLSVAASKQDRADARRLATALKDGDALRGKASRLREAGAEIHAEESDRDARRAEQKVKKLSAAGVYLGSSKPQSGLKPGRKYVVEIDGTGVRIVEGFKPKAVIPWETVTDVEVIDASRMEIKSRVEQRATGGIWSLPGTMAPVNRTSSKHIARSKLALTTQQGDWLLEIHADAGRLEGKILLARGTR
jgi:hypothetical protein